PDRTEAAACQRAIYLRGIDMRVEDGLHTAQTTVWLNVPVWFGAVSLGGAVARGAVVGGAVVGGAVVGGTPR
ncbi:MAG: hypothetical protein K0U71_03015, partial [Actinomycetia bacterium]|nr:hypothetical protein [Actinomycetes bacterium]